MCFCISVEQISKPLYDDLIPTLLFLALRLHSAEVSSRRVGVYISDLSFSAVAVFIGVGVNYATGPQNCWKYNYFMPYEELVAKLRAACFKKDILITNDYPNQIDENLKRYLPQVRISGGAAWIICSAKSCQIWLMLYSMEYGFSNVTWQLVQCQSLCCQALWY